MLSKIISIICFPILFMHLRAESVIRPIGTKDGINLYARFAEPYDNNNPKLIRGLENTTKTPVVFQFRGSSEGPAFEMHLFDSSGLEIEKNAVWRLKYETDSSIHVRYGIIPNGQKLEYQEIGLRDVYGDKWSEGVRLEILWNVGELRTGQGPVGGVFGIGSGVRGEINIPPPEGDATAGTKSIKNITEENREMKNNTDKLIDDSDRPIDHRKISLELCIFVALIGIGILYLFNRFAKRL